MEHIVSFAYIPNLDDPLQWGYFSCVTALVILGLVFAALGFVKCHEVYEISVDLEKSQPRQAPRIGIADPDPSHDEKHHALFPGDSVVSPTERLSLSSDENDDDSTKMIRHLETTPISDDQLIAEVQGIYAGLVVVETKCIEVHNELLSNNDANPKLNSEQWEALIALHTTLLHEHYDFFLASQHPSASPALRNLASKYEMPARMWRHGIHSFLELLRHRLPACLEHMLTFFYSAYSMMALLYETVPAFEDTWMECLGDLGRYRMAIEDDDIRVREAWTDVSRHWYSKVSERSPTTGRLYHHLAILERHREGSSILNATPKESLENVGIDADERYLELESMTEE